MLRTDINVPKDLSDRTLLDFFHGWKWIKNPEGLVTLDFRGADFISPWAITLFASYALWLREVKKRNVRIEIDPDTVAGHYVCKTGFREILGEQVASHISSNEERTTPLTRIKTSSEIPQFTSRVMQLLQIGDSELEGAIKYSLVELLRNVVQHSTSPIGGVAMAQYFANTGLVELVVADMGVGIRQTLSRRYPEIDNELKAIKFAVQPHVSGTFRAGAYNEMKENAGLGLFFIKQIVTLSGGGFFLASGRWISDIWGDKEGIQKKIYRQSIKVGWPGTFGVLQLRRDTIGDFDSVLATCRKLAEEARKNPAELALDFIQEIPDLDDMVVIRVGEFEENVEEAGRIRETIISPALEAGKFIVIDFSGVRFATQSFVHALMYKVLRDNENVATALSIANCTKSTREAILAVAGYARVSDTQAPKNWNL